MMNKGSINPIEDVGGNRGLCVGECVSPCDRASPIDCHMKMKTITIKRKKRGGLGLTAPTNNHDHN